MVGKNPLHFCALISSLLTDLIDSSGGKTTPIPSSGHNFMLDPTLSAIADGLSRCHVMRIIDSRELRVVVETTDAHRLLRELRPYERREAWRVRREDELLEKLQACAADKDGQFWKRLCDLVARSSMVRDPTEEAAAAAVGAHVVHTLHQNPIVTPSPNVAASLFDIASPHATVCGKLLQRNAPLTTSDGFTVESAIESLSGSPSSTSAHRNASLRELLLRTSQQFRTCMWLWQRYNTVAGAAQGVAGGVARDLWGERNGSTGEVSVPNLFRAFLATQRRMFAEAREDLSAKLPACFAPAVGGESAARRPLWTWSPESDAKWRQYPRLVVAMQSRARGFIVRRRYGQRLESIRADMANLRSHRIERQLMPTALRYLKQSQSTAFQYVELAHEIVHTQAALEDFYDTEETNFQNQWDAYVKQLTRFYLHECPLDPEWVVQSSAPPQPAHPAPSPAGGASSAAAAGVVYLNVKSGRVQTENPNVLKIVAAKNRQLLKASKERATRLAEASRRAEELNAMKTSLNLLSKRLQTPVFL